MRHSGRLVLSIAFFIFISYIVSADAPPTLPMEIWGNALVDGNPVPDGSNVSAIINGKNYAQSYMTQNGLFDVIIGGSDSPLTNISDPSCTYAWSKGETCIPCSINISSPDYCLEGPQEGELVTLNIGGGDSQQTFPLQSGTINSQNVTITTVYLFIKNLSAGWHLISLPVNPGTTSMPAVLSSISGKYSIVWTTTATGAWKSSTQPVSPLTTIVPEKSYLIKMEQNGQWKINGTKVTWANVSYVNGWNLIGFPSMSQRNFSVMIGTPYQIIWTTTSVPAWKSSTQPVSPLTKMTPMDGYMVQMSGQGSYIVTN